MHAIPHSNLPPEGLTGRAADIRDGDGERLASRGLSTCFTEDSHHHSATQETVIGSWRSEELPASIQLDVHVEGRRADCRQPTCRLPAVKRSDASTAVGLPATPLNGDGASTGSVGHFLRC